MKNNLANFLSLDQLLDSNVRDDGLPVEVTDSIMMHTAFFPEETAKPPT